ncbi:tyrosine-type recombinase/integrase [Microlunatus parietis]|uniref:tyrosine-type recombinase/integrase n=1 Tax=Microlunatus parietis TaxID=682979 RepID=UPI001FE68179|nr:site-specific integrase [Microlunatus parietis]
MATRNPNRASSIYEGSDGYWHGRVTVGFKDDGSIDRRHVMRKSKAEVVTEVRKLERARDQGAVPKAGKRWTVASWLDHWLETIARPSVRESSFNAYRNAVRTHLVPNLGKNRLERLEPEHLERLYRKMIEAGASPGNAHQVHRTIRTALGEAQRRQYVGRNVAALAKAPRVDPEPVEPFRIDEVQRILDAAATGRNSARWAIALALGLRQGEALALKWSDVDLDTATLRVRFTRQRPMYGHGCGGTCDAKAGYCPERKQLTPTLGLTKSRAGKRVIGLPDELVAMLKLHREVQDQERRNAGQLWNAEGDWVFATETGDPVNLNSDYHAWKALLKRAGVRTARLHDARHTAATTCSSSAFRNEPRCRSWDGPAPQWLPGTSTSPTRSGVMSLGGSAGCSGPPTKTATTTRKRASETRTETRQPNAGSTQTGRPGVLLCYCGPFALVTGWFPRGGG